MENFPENHELIGLFECEPILTDPEQEHWFYNQLIFHTVRCDDALTVKINGCYGDLSILWKQGSRELMSFKFEKLSSLEVEMQTNDEFLTAIGSFYDFEMLVKLRLKPQVAIELKQLSNCI
ncbi:MAG: hypothetical protein ABJH06_09275 [Paraglaciecola sp.]|uniref:hypothetical protein n=1 Tax=Paraglaciecola sp. TaxID=1920173 RepID=UPI003297A3CB